MSDDHQEVGEQPAAVRRAGSARAPRRAARCSSSASAVSSTSQSALWNAQPQPTPHSGSPASAASPTNASAGPRGGAQHVGQLELAEQLRLERRFAQVGRVGQRVDAAAVGAVQVGVELRQAVAVRRQRARRSGRPRWGTCTRRRDPAATSASASVARAQPAPVAPVEEAAVRLDAPRHARPARDLRVAAVGGDDELGAHVRRACARDPRCARRPGARRRAGPSRSSRRSARRPASRPRARAAAGRACGA